MDASIWQGVPGTWVGFLELRAVTLPGTVSDGARGGDVVLWRCCLWWQELPFFNPALVFPGNLASPHVQGQSLPPPSLAPRAWPDPTPSGARQVMNELSPPT